MAKMIGEGATPAQINYTFGDDAWRLASSNIDAIRQLTGTITKEFKDHKEKKDAVKVGADKIDAVAKLFGDESGAFAGIAAQLKDEEIPLSQRAGLAREIDSIASLATDKFKLDMQQSQFDRGMRLDEERQRWEGEGRQRALDELSRQDEAAAYMARPFISALGGQIKAMESQGIATPVSSEQLKSLFMEDPKTALAKAQSVAALLPAQQQREFKELPITMPDGQPGTIAALVDMSTGQAQPVQMGGVVDFVKGFEGFSPSAYSDHGQTSIGYGTRAKPGESQITPQEAEARLIKELASAREDVVREAGKAGLNLTPQQLDALTSFQYNTGSVKTLLKGGERSPEEIADAINLYNKASGKVLPGLVRRRAQESQMFRMGAANTAPPTEFERRKQELEIAKLEGDAQKAEQEAKDAQINEQDAIAKMRSTIKLTEQIEESAGFQAAVGVQANPFQLLPGSSKKETLAMINQLKGKQFLDAVGQMKGMGALSNAEGEKIAQAAGRLEINMSEAAFKAALAEIRTTIEGALARRGAAPATGVTAQDQMQKDLREIRGR